VQVVVAAVLLNPNHWRKHPAVIRVPGVGPHPAGGIAVLVPGCSCRFRRLLLVQVVPELFYADPGKYTKHSSLVFIELFWRGPAELGILGFPVECLDSGQREMGQALAVIDEVVDALDGEVHAVAQVHPLERTQDGVPPPHETLDGEIGDVVALD